jgi:hypothetical protein
VRTIRLGRVLVVAVATAVFVLMSPGSALATRVVSQVSGPDIAAALLSNLRSIDVGSEDATVGVASAAGTHDVHVSFGEIGRELAETKDGSALLGLAAIPLLGGAFLRFVAFIARLTRS